MVKIHISNIHNAALSDRVKLQHKLAEAGHALGMYELGIFSYPVDSDTPEQLSTRLDGLVSSLEHGDRVILQLPTGNGREFEEKLAWRIQTYTGHYPFFLVSTEIGKDYLSMLHNSERVLAVKRWLYEDLKEVMGRDASEKLFFHYADETTSELDDRACLTGFLDELGDLKENKDAIQVCFALHDNDGTYSSRVAVAMLSVMRKTKSPVCFHILLDESVDEVNRRRLKRVARSNGAEVEFHLLPLNFGKEYISNYYLKLFSTAGLFRMLLPDLLLEVKQVIYLDADIMVNCDLVELWNQHLYGKSIGAVVDSGIKKGRYTSKIIGRGLVEKDKYFNSGVLLMNLNRIREKGNLWEKFLSFIEKNSNAWLIDQDALNCIFKDDIYFLDSKWNTLIIDERADNPKLQPAIYHFAGDKRIYYYNFTDIDRVYLDLREEVPFERNIIDNVFLQLLNSNLFKIDELQKLIGKLSERPQKIIFYGEDRSSLRTMTRIIGAENIAYFIDGSSSNSNKKRYDRPVKPFSELKEEEKGTFVVIVLPDADQNRAIEKVEKINLKRDIDYFVAPTMTTKPQGGYEV